MVLLSSNAVHSVPTSTVTQGDLGSHGSFSTQQVSSTQTLLQALGRYRAASSDTDGHLRSNSPEKQIHLSHD